MSFKSKLMFLLAAFSFICFIVVKFLVGAWIPFLWIPIGLIFVFIAIAVASDFSLYKEFFTMKTTKKGLNMGTIIMLVLVFLVTINFLSVRKYKTFDLSLAKVNTLSDQSLKLLDSLTEDLKVYYFYKTGDEGVETLKRQFIELIKKYQDQSPMVKLEFVEVNERPDLAEKFEINKGTGVVFVEYKSRKNRVDKIDEQEMTGAILKVTKEGTNTVYFVTGHGEKDLSDNNTANGIGALKLLLEGNRYVVNVISLNEKSEIPQDAKMVFVVGPEQSFLSHEVQALERYLEKGGSLLLAIDPLKNHGLKPLLNKIGIDYVENYVVQVSEIDIGAPRKVINPAATPITDFSAAHPITKPFGKNSFGVMRLPGFLKKSNTGDKWNFQELGKTNTASLAFSDNRFSNQTAQGPLVMIASTKGKLSDQAESKEFNAVVFADADLFTNQLLFQNMNRDLVLNSAAFLAKDDSLISITPKEVGVTEMTLTENSFFLYVFAFIIPLPLVLLLTSGALWYRRRNA